MSADGAAHVLARDARTACWWIVDEAGDARLGGRWDRTRREPLRMVATADGRAVAVLRDEAGALRLTVRAEGSGDRRLAALSDAPAALVAHPTRPLVAVRWAEETWLVDIDTGERVRCARGETPAWVSAGGFDAPR